MADTQTEAPKFDPIAYQRQANEQEQAHRNGKPLEPPIAEKPKEPEKPKEAAAEESDTEKERRISRSDRRRLKAFEEAAEWKGKAEALQSIVDRLGGNKSEPAPPTGQDDPEPLRTAYSSDADYNRALGRWDARQAAAEVVNKAKKESASAEEDAQWNQLEQAMFAKMLEDSKELPGWDEAAKKMAEPPDPDATAEELAEYDLSHKIADKSQLDRLVKASEYRAHVLLYFANHPKVLAEFNLMQEGPRKLRDFGRLEARAEKLYSSEEPEKDKAAQAVEETLKDRTHPAEAQAGRNSAVRDSGKPRPSTEVAARGGSAPPGDIRIGSPEWHRRENEREREMRGR